MTLLRHLSGYAPVSLAQGLAAFGGVYVFTRLIPEDYGLYALLVWAGALIHTVSLSWVEAAAYRFAGEAEAGGEADTAAHARRALKLMAASLAGALALVAALGLWAHAAGEGRVLAVLPWLAGVLVADAVVKVALETHKAGQRVRRYAVSETFRILAGFALGAWLAWHTGLGAAAPFAGLLASGAVIALREGAWLRRRARGAVLNETAPPSEPAASRTSWPRYGWPVAFALGLDLLVAGADRPMIAFFLGEDAVGAYASGYGVADKTVLLLCAWAAMAGGPLMMAAMERGGPRAAAAEGRALLQTLLLIGVPAATGLALVAEPLAGALVGEAFRAEAARIIPWIAPAGLLNGLMIHYASESFQLSKRTGERALLMIVPALANIALNLALIPVFGLMGAVWATLLSYALGLALLMARGRRHVPLLWEGRAWARTLLAAGVMAAGVTLLQGASGNLGPWLRLVVEGASGAALYAAAAFALDAGGARRWVRRPALGNPHG